MEIDGEVIKGNTCVVFLDDGSAVCVGLDRVVESRLHLYLAVATTKPINFFFPPQESRQEKTTTKSLCIVAKLGVSF